MLKTGKLASHTLVAADGGAAWITLQSLQEQQNTTATCPRCDKPVAPDTEHNTTQLPLHCPHCGEQLRPTAPGSMLSNMGFGCKHLFSFKGRASRTEFWSMVLLSLICIPGVHIAGFLFLCTMLDFSYVAFPYVIMGYMGMWAILLLFFAALSTRRMRDAGYSPKIVWGLSFYPLSVLMGIVAEQHAIRMSFIYKFMDVLMPLVLIVGPAFTIIILILATEKSKYLKQPQPRHGMQ